MMKKIFYLFFAALCIGGLSFFQACGDGSNENDMENMDADFEADSKLKDKASKVREVLYSIPSPVETATLVKMSGVDFNKSSMNNPNKVGDYNTTKSQAFNLGVYGSDLAYSSIFEQSQEALNYFSAVKLLSDELGVSGVINDENISRFERNIESKDSLVVFVNEIFWAIDATLVEDDRGYVSAIVMAGGWVEAVYILLKNGKEMKGSDLDKVKQLVSDQQYSLQNIIKLIDTYEDDNNLVVLSAEFIKLNELFNRIVKQDNETLVNKDANGKVVIGGNDSVTISDELLGQIYDEVNKIRIKYVN
jgi:hypothetical protein